MTLLRFGHAHTADRTLANPQAILARVASVDGAKARCRETIEASRSLSEEAVGPLMSDLGALERGYRTQTKWIGRSARWLRRGAVLLSHFVAPIVGPAALAGVFLLGAGYVAYSLTDRLDARELGFADRVEGVVKLVARHVSV